MDVSFADYLVRATAWQVNPKNLPLKFSNPDLLKEIEIKFNKEKKEDFLDWLTDKTEFSIALVGSHINWWNFDKIKTFLNSAGFTLVYPSSFGASIAAPMRNTQKFDKTVPEESIYVEAIKL